MTLRHALAVTALSCWAVAGLAQEAFETRLSIVPINRSNQAATTGVGHARVELDGNRLTVEGRFEGLQGPATVASLHLGAATGVRGPAIHDLTVTSAAAGELSGSVRLSNREVDALRDGRIYIQVHSESAPDGNLWGWLL